MRGRIKYTAPYELIKGHDGCRVFVDKDRPRVEIEIMPIV